MAPSVEAVGKVAPVSATRNECAQGRAMRMIQAEENDEGLYSPGPPGDEVRVERLGGTPSRQASCPEAVALCGIPLF